MDIRQPDAITVHIGEFNKRIPYKDLLEGSKVPEVLDLLLGQACEVALQKMVDEMRDSGDLEC